MKKRKWRRVHRLDYMRSVVLISTYMHNRKYYLCSSADVKKQKKKNFSPVPTRKNVESWIHFGLRIQESVV